MSQTLGSALHDALRLKLIEHRKAAKLSQAAVAQRLGRHQSFVANVETGQRRVDVVELLALAKAIGFNASDLLNALAEEQP